MSPKLLLFDIDGTLILSGGMGKQAMLTALSEVFEQPFEADITDFAGSTDRHIIHNLMARYRVGGDATASLMERVLARYEHHLGILLSDNHHIEVMPGIVSLLERCRALPEYHLGLLTGNIVSGARIKLSPVGLWDYFPVGGFGSDAVDRNRIPPIAVARAEAHYGVQYPHQDIWVIGDTPRDIECGKVNGYRTLAVTTGHYDLETLAAHAPDLLLENLADTEAVLAQLAISGKR